ncbi:MAG: hypothetical protein LUE31_06865 [Lachnospiraceae bacterium]|nr:hypothetical protein [Lachnospiraceae bacterium]
MKTIYRFSGKCMLLFYISGLYQLWRLCQYGGVRRRLPGLTVSAAAFLLCLILWLVSRRGRPERESGRRKRVIFLLELALFAGTTLFFGTKIVRAATPYNGALSWKLDEWRRKREVAFTHDNFYESGAEGILEDLDAAFDLPETLYVTNTFEIAYDAEGTIQTIEAFLYGENDEGEKKTYLISYDAEKSGKMTVWLDGNVSAEYEEENLLEPMLTILGLVDWERQLDQWSALISEEVCEVSYSGCQSFASKEGLYEVSENGIALESDAISRLDAGGEICGYAVTLDISEEIPSLYFILEPEYVSQSELNAEREEEQTAEAIDAESWYVDSADGTMYYFLNESRGWRLVVVDAAAGSRAYALQGTDDGGASWTDVNGEPFLGAAGVAEGLIFYDENWGIAGLGSASGSYSRLYVTWDGGESFTQIVLDMDAAEELPDTAAEYGLAAQDYDYLCMPEEKDGVLTVLVTTDQIESEGVFFESADEGWTWEFAGVCH